MNIQTNHLMSDFVLCISRTVLFISQLNHKPEQFMNMTIKTIRHRIEKQEDNHK